MRTDPMIDRITDMVSSEYARLKEANVKNISFSAILSSVLRNVGVSDPEDFRRLKKKMGSIFAARKQEHQVAARNYRRTSF